MTNQEYHSDRSAISSSQLKRLDPPARFNTPETFSDDRPLKLGTAVHTLVLEPDLFETDFFIGDGRTKEAKEAKDLGKNILSPSDFEVAKGMAKAVRSHGLAKDLLSDGVAEQSFFWEHPIEYSSKIMRCHYCNNVLDTTKAEFTGETTCDCGEKIKVFSVRCKIRPDYLGTNHFVDLKTTTSANKYAFWGKVKSLGYHMSAAMYWAGLEAHGYDIQNFYWIVVENTRPYLTAVFEPDAEFMDEGHRLFEERLKIYRKCKDLDVWPGYEDSQILNFTKETL